MEWRIQRNGRWPNRTEWCLDTIKLARDSPHLEATAGYQSVLSQIRREERRKKSKAALEDLFDHPPNYAVRIGVCPYKEDRRYITLGSKYGMRFCVPPNRRFWNHRGYEITQDRAAAELALFCTFCLDNLYNDHHQSIADELSKPGLASFKFWPNAIRERYQLLIIPPEPNPKLLYF